MKLSKIPFEKIANGEKVIESRLYDDKRQQVRVGDEIEFTNTEDSGKKVRTKVVALYLYPNFASMFSDFPPEKFGGTSAENLLSEIKRFYSETEQEQFGVIGIKIALA